MPKLYRRKNGAFNLNLSVAANVAPHLAAALKVLEQVAALEAHAGNTPLVLQGVVKFAREKAQEYELPWPDPFETLEDA